MKIFYLTVISYFTSVLSEIEVYITLSATIDKYNTTTDSGNHDTTLERRITLNWRNVPIIGCDNWVVLFKSEPNNSSDTTYFQKYINFLRNGHKRTEEPFIVKNLTKYGDNLPDGCLSDINGNQWHIAYISNGQIIAKNCLKAYPFWMQNNLKIIGNYKLNELVIPGSHDAACYTLLNNPKPNYKYCQSDSIYDQLVYGIRYFDIRGGYITGESEPLQIVHSFWECGHTLRDVLTQVKTFLDRAPEEVVIFDFHLFQKGFDDTNTTVLIDKHMQVLNLVKEVVGNYIINDTLVNYTINQLVSINKRLVIGYVNKSKGYFNQMDTHLLWENVKHQWANADNAQHLENWFNDSVCADTHSQLKSAMAQLTPTAFGLIFDTYGGLRKMADDINWRYRYWFLDQWSDCVNIISADFIMGSDVVNIAIELNKRNFYRTNKLE